ncbi:MAG: hypothetical protein K6G42_00020, partial [Lachnospiraceae bacterium]|nr:hypothetical protein [Lachnospiraceae bacterium]
MGDEDITLEDPPVEPDTEDIKEEPVKEEPQDGGVKDEPTKEEIKEEPSKEEKGDWFEAHNLKLTPQGDFSFHTMLYEKDKGDLGEMWLPGTVKITENTNDVPAGYKNVVAYFELSVAHMDNMENRAPNHWITAFDKKTGICFETDDENPAKDENGFVTIDGADGSFKEKVKFEYGWKDNGTIRQARATVTVPSDYEDTVFQIGYGSTELAEESDRTIDLKSRLYRIDELLFFDTNGHEYLYFAADKNGASGMNNSGNNNGV